jgi:hypothetical protein
MSAPPSTTRFVSRGRLSGVLREKATRHRGTNPPGQPELQPIDEALYYRARLILGESLPRPGR